VSLHGQVDRAIRCIGLTKAFSDISTGAEIVALRDLTLDIEAGAFVTILGPSGCGKTTLLNIIAGFEKPTDGDVTIGRQPIAGPGPDRGVVFQEYALFPWLTVAQNVGYGLVERGVRKQEVKDAVHGWLEQVGLEDFDTRYPHELSGGMRQRAALVRVLANESEILLMDEPFAALDALTRTALQRELALLWGRTDKTVIFVTHNVDEAILLGDRMIVMTGRPGSLKVDVGIDLPRPRDPTSESFNQYRRIAAVQLETEIAVQVH